ncbi:hypothetical protein NDU88_003266 [Pleurodeles waltl]|uniref:Uncharacterized protein n=1 Tax=Pleurodeles waltl TaxID=8319 RepID=A0AAV7TP85_PLEWA|nr:hypothetical protein NDU88_003266 [Pleurodeles waltl]
MHRRHARPEGGLRGPSLHVLSIRPVFGIHKFRGVPAPTHDLLLGKGRNPCFNPCQRGKQSADVEKMYHVGPQKAWSEEGQDGAQHYTMTLGVVLGYVVVISLGGLLAEAEMQALKTYSGSENSGLQRDKDCI